MHRTKERNVFITSSHQLIALAVPLHPEQLVAYSRFRFAAVNALFSVLFFQLPSHFYFVSFERGLCRAHPDTRVAFGGAAMRVSTSPSPALRVSRRRRGVTRCLSFAFVAYAAYALLGATGRNMAGTHGSNGGSATRASPECAANFAKCWQARGGGLTGTELDETRAPSPPHVVTLQLPDVDPASGKSRTYTANHVFHVCEFHAHNHARLLEGGDLVSGGRGGGTGGGGASGGGIGGTSQSGTNGNSGRTSASAGSVVFRVPTKDWSQKLTPTTRLLLAASYTDGHVATIGFVEPGEVGSSLGSGLGSILGGNGDGDAENGDETLAGTGGKGASKLTQIPLRCGWRDRGFRVSTRQQPLHERFVVSANLFGNDDGNGLNNCEPTFGVPAGRGSYANPVSFGAKKAERGDWLPKESDVESFRHALDGLCADDSFGGDESKSKSSQTHGKKADAAAAAAAAALLSQPCGSGSDDGNEHVKHLVIYQRNTGRVLENLPELVRRLELALRRFAETTDGDARPEKEKEVWKISTVTHHDAFPPCLLRQCLAKATVLLTPHGFQSMLYLFLPPNAHLHEVFPHRYYKHGYKRAALEWGLSFGFSMSPPRSVWSSLIGYGFTTNACMQMYYCRYFARKGDVFLTNDDVDLIARSAAVASSRGRTRGRANEVETGGHASEKFKKLVKWEDSSDKQATRATCLATCAAKHGCQLFSVDTEKQTCATRLDAAQGEKDGDVFGAGIYNNKCYVPGCR